MTACTQPGCTGRIVDGYCDVCGSPAGAAPWLPAESAASVASPAPAVEAGLTGVGRGSGASARPSNGLISACTQPGCTGRIVDSYCDVCGSPANAAPFVSAGAAASPASPAPADEPSLTAAVPASTPAPAPVDEGIPTLFDLRWSPETTDSIDIQGSREATLRRLIEPAAADMEEGDIAEAELAATDTGKELVEGEPDDAQDYRTRVEEAQLPDDVREAALCEVGKLERTSAQSAESRDIRTWLDTILDLPWSTKITDSIDIQESSEVEATLRRLIGPAAADVEVGDTAMVEPAAADVEVCDTAMVEPAAADVEVGDTAAVEPAAADVEEEADTAAVEPAAADIEEADTAPAGPQHDDTVKMPGVPAVLSGGRHQRPQLPEQQVLGPEPIQTPAKKRRIGSLALAATVLAALLIGAVLFAASRDGGVTTPSVPTVTATATATVSKPTSEPSNKSTDTGGAGTAFQLENLDDSARPFQPARIQGTYRGGPDRFLQVQRWEGGKWLSFPVPTKTDQSGQFTAFVELGQPGRYRLRVLDPHSDVRSKTFVLVIEG